MGENERKAKQNIQYYNMLLGLAGFRSQHQGEDGFHSTGDNPEASKG